MTDLDLPPAVLGCHDRPRLGPSRRREFGSGLPIRTGQLVVMSHASLHCSMPATVSEIGATDWESNPSQFVLETNSPPWNMRMRIGEFNSPPTLPRNPDYRRRVTGRVQVIYGDLRSPDDFPSRQDQGRFGDWSERLDLNQRPPASRAGRLA